MKRALFALLVVLLSVLPVRSDSAGTSLNGLVLSSCGSATYTANTYQSITLDTTGVMCLG